ncbi:MAG: PorV/PorQ family protein [Elusimicrobiota bacterium]
MSRRKLISIWAVCLILGAGGRAEGGETASFLKISPGARPIGMGNAFTAIADDLNALAWNPAGLADAKQREASFMHAELYAHTRFDFIGYAQPLDQLGLSGTFAIGVSRLSQETISGRDENRRPTGSFTAADTAYQAAYSGRFFNSGTNFGLSGKYLQSALGDTRASAFAVDIGVKQHTNAGGRDLTFGASVMNIGRGMRYLDETDDLPLTFSAGTGLRMFSNILLAADIRHRPHSQQTSFSFGSEYIVLPTLTLRAGYGTLFNSSTRSAGSASSAISQLQGMGMGMGLKVGRATLNYSFAPAGELGNTQRLSVSTRF